MTEVLGIDLGTTYSCVGIFQDGKVAIIPNELGNNTTPSIVAFNDGKILVGEAAKELAPIHPKNIVYDAKRMLGRTFDDPVLQNDMKRWPFKVVKGPGNRPQIEIVDEGKTKRYFPEEISAEVLKYLAKCAKKTLGHEVKDVVITVPAYFKEAQRYSTKEAAIKAGLNVLAMIPEPTAASIAFGRNVGDEEDHNAFIFDLGGGTFDISIVSISSGVYEVKCIEGDSHLGGQDFDNEIAKYCIEEFNKANHCDASNDVKAINLMKNAAEKAKIVLSSGVKNTDIRIDQFFQGHDLNVKLTAATFNDINKKHFDKLIPIIRRSLSGDEIDKDDITDLLFVGGSSRVPRVRDMLQEEFPPLTPYTAVSPDEAVAYGAAIHGYQLTHDDDDDGCIVLCEVSPYTVGVEVLGQKLEPLVEHNDKIPTSVTKTFETTYDDQEKVNIIVLENESNEHGTKNNLMSQFDVEVPPKKKGEVKIDITFTIGTDYQLKVDAKVKGGKKESKVIQLSDRHAPGEPKRSEIVRKKQNEMDLVFCVDATGSMAKWITATVQRCESIAKSFREKNKDVNIKVGAVFYRDPIDVPGEKHVVYDLTDNVKRLSEQMSKEVADGGGDTPEDWVGCYKLVLNNISWRKDASHVIIHMADAPAHGKEWGLEDKHPDQGPLLPPLIRECARKNIYFTGIMIHDCSRKSFENVRDIYVSEGKGKKVKIVEFKESENLDANDFLEEVAKEILLAIVASKK